MCAGCGEPLSTHRGRFEWHAKCPNNTKGYQAEEESQRDVIVSNTKGTVTAYVSIDTCRQAMFYQPKPLFLSVK